MAEFDPHARAEAVYRQFNPEEAKVGDVLMPHGWKRIHANEWKKTDGKRFAKVTLLASGLKGAGDLNLLAEATALLTPSQPTPTMSPERMSLMAIGMILASDGATKDSQLLEQIREVVDEALSTPSQDVEGMVSIPVADLQQTVIAVGMAGVYARREQEEAGECEVGKRAGVNAERWLNLQWRLKETLRRLSTPTEKEDRP